MTQTSTPATEQPDQTTSDAPPPPTNSNNNDTENSDKNNASSDTKKEVISSSSSSSPMKKLKRGADRQITKDDADADDGDGDNKGEVIDGFKRANADTLKKRKILKVKRSNISGTAGAAVGGNASSAGDETCGASTAAVDKSDKTSNGANGGTFAGLSFAGAAASNPFASIQMSGGGGFGGFSSSSNNGGNDESEGVKQSTTLSFASSANSNPFAAASSKLNGSGSGFSGFGSGWGKTVADSSKVDSIASSSSTEKTNPAQSVDDTASASAGGILQTEENISNGEEGEECLFECRAKLFRLAKKIIKEKVQKSPNMDNVSNGIVAASQKEQSQLSSGKQEESKNDKNEKESEKQEEAKNEMEWREVGIGPARLLKKSKNGSSSTRVVMRRETQPGGSGTKVILNLQFRDGLAKAEKSGEKFVQLTIISDKKEVYLFKVKKVEEADRMMTLMNEAILNSKHDSG